MADARNGGIGMTIAERCTQIANQVVPRYRTGKPLSCTGQVARMWQAAWDGACRALGGDPARYVNTTGKGQ